MSFYVYEKQYEPEKGAVGMREINFRALSTNNKDWIYGFPLLYGFENWIADSGGMKRNIKPKTVGQFTGLKDKNGVEIYEGDVVKRGYNSGSSFVGEVISEEATYFMRNDEQYSFLANQYDSETLEIIGNIHENPELLEVTT